MEITKRDNVITEDECTKLIKLIYKKLIIKSINFNGNHNHINKDFTCLLNNLTLQLL